MKILSLRLKNLNSLKGEWKIDFTAEPFARMPSAWRCTTKRRVLIRSLRRKTT